MNTTKFLEGFARWTPRVWSVPAGAEINECAEIACAAATGSQRSISFVHNGTEVEALPGETPDAVVRKWSKARDK